MTYKVWVALDNGSWFPSGDPALGTGGYDLSAIDGFLLFPIASGSGFGSSTQTFNFGQTAFNFAVPSVFTSGWPGSGAGGFTEFDPAKVNGTITLTNNNRTFKNNSGGAGYVQGLDGKASGKYYFEIHYDSVNFGIADFFGGGVGRAYPGISYFYFTDHYGAYGAADLDGGITAWSNHPLTPDYDTSIGVLGTQVQHNPFRYGVNTTLRFAVSLGDAPPTDTRTTGLSEMFFSPTAGFVDLTDPANLAKFATDAGCTVGIGAHGTGPFGLAPPVFFNQVAGSGADTWATNMGTGGGFNLTGSLTTASGPCCGPGEININTQPEPVIVYLRWSDNRGKSFGNPMGQTMGAPGEYLTVLQWNRLGMARDRVYELFWSATNFTTLQGAFLDPPIKLGS